MEFNLEAILSVTTGRLLTKAKQNSNGIEDIYELLSFMCGEDVWTHQLWRFADECLPYILKQYPQLDAAEKNLAMLDSLIEKNENKRAACEGYIKWLRQKFELLPYYDLQPIPKDDHTSTHPQKELEDTVGKEKVVVINSTED